MDEAVVDALAERSVALEGTTPGESRADLAPVLDRLADADVVGLGEAVHGSRALFELKARLVRGLVADRGVRTVALEGDVAAAAALDRHVRDGEGDPAGALSDLVVWPWQARELANLLAWLRRFNEGRPADDQVRVHGISPNDATRPAGRLRARLDDLAPGVPGADDALATVAAGDLPDDGDALDELLATVRAVGDALEAGEATADGRRARLDCRAVAQAIAWHRTRSEHEGPHQAGMAHRDRIMADNVLAALGDDPGAGVVVWAHDSHVKRGSFDDGTAWTDAATMGEQLAAELGGRYRPVGSDVGRGTVRARPAGEDGPPERFELGEPLAGSATAHLDAVGGAPLFVDLGAGGDGTAALEADDRLADWLAGDPPTRWVGSVYDPDAGPDHHHLQTDLAASFDGLLYVAESGPTRPVDGD